MPSTKSEPKEFTPWNAPNLLTNQFQLLFKLVVTLNTNVPPENVDWSPEIFKQLELKSITVFSHHMMPTWLTLAKSYYPFYQISDHDKILITDLEQKLNINATNYESLSQLITEAFLAHALNVNSQYQPFIDNIIKAMAKLTTVALSTPSLINDAHKRDKKQYEEAGPSISTCIGPIETILHQMMNKGELDKSFVVAASSLLLQVKAIKSHFEQLTLIQELENIQVDNTKLREQIEKYNIEKENIYLFSTDQEPKEDQSKILYSCIKNERIQLIKVFKLQKKINQYCDHLNEVLAKSPEDKKLGAKLACMNLMKNDIEKEYELPSQRIERFIKQLNKTKEQLQEHRDPMWTRFLRDCIRILALLCSGVAIYRTLRGQPVTFFKPSHGQNFVEEANRTLFRQEKN